jgi:hypothetical protein
VCDGAKPDHLINWEAKTEIIVEKWYCRGVCSKRAGALSAYRMGVLMGWVEKSQEVH